MSDTELSEVSTWRWSWRTRARLNCKVDNLLLLSGDELHATSVDWGYGAAGGQLLEKRFANSADEGQHGVGRQGSTLRGDSGVDR